MNIFGQFWNNGLSKDADAHSLDAVVWDERDLPEHMPDTMTFMEYERLQAAEVGASLEQMFINGTAFKGAVDVCRDWSQKIPYPRQAEVLIYGVSFIVTGFLIYRLPRLIMAEVPVDADLASFIIAGLLGLALEITIGSILFGKPALKAYCTSKLNAQLSCITEELEHYPFKRHLLFAVQRVIKGVIPDVLESRYTVWEWIAIALVILGFAGEVAAALRSLETYGSLDYSTLAAAFLPPIIVFLFSLIFAHAIYVPKGKNRVADLFLRKLRTYNFHDIEHRIALNNELFDQLLYNPNLSHQDIKETKVRYGIEFEQQSHDRLRERALVRKAWVRNHSGRDGRERVRDFIELDRIEAQTRLRGQRNQRSVERLAEQLNGAASVPNEEGNGHPLGTDATD